LIGKDILMKKMMLLAALVLSFVATAGTVRINPIPGCNPCDWVR